MPVGTITKDKVRLSLDVSIEVDDLLKQLARKTNGTKSDVLRKAIALMKVAVDAKEQDNKLAILDKDNKLKSELVGI